MTDRVWTDEDVEKIAGLLRDGLSAGKICKHFVGVSRNAIIGKVARHKTLKAIGLKGQEAKPSWVKREPAPPKKAKAVNTNVVAMKRAAPPAHRVWPSAPTLFECRQVPLIDLKPRECKWPVNDAARGEVHLFCGLPAGEGPYCAGHYGRSVRGALHHEDKDA